MKKRRKTFAGMEQPPFEEKEEQLIEVPGPSTLKFKEAPMRKVSVASRKISKASRKTSSLTRPLTGSLGVEGDDIWSVTSMAAPGENLQVRRPIYSQHQFESIFTEQEEEENLKSQFIDTVYLPPMPPRTCVDMMLQLLPILRTLQDYSFKRDFPFDLLSGVTTGVMRIPQSMAYSLLALLPPVHGLYTALVASLVYCVLGTSPHLVVTCQGVVALLVGQVAKEFVERLHNVRLDSNSSGEVPSGRGSDGLPLDINFVREELLQTILTVTLIVGILQVLMSFMKLGMLTNYLSDPLIGGFTTGVAIEIICSQLSTIIGHEVEIASDMPPVGMFDNFKIVYIAVSNLSSANPYTLIISGCAVLFMAALKRANRFVKRRWKLTIPAELLIVLMSTGASAVFGFEKLEVAMVGNIPSGLPKLQPPKSILIDSILLRDAVILAIVSFAISTSMSKKFSLKHDNEIDSNQEFLAYGAGNIAGCFMGSFVSTCSMTCTNLHVSIGGRTQIANLVASLLVLITLLFFGFFFASTPSCILSAIIIVNLRSVLWQIRDLPQLWRISKIDLALWVVSFLAVIFTDANSGILFGIAFSLMTVIFRFQWPYVCLLGRIEHTEIYKNVFLTPNAKQVNGIKIFRFEGPLFFSSAEHFRRSLYELVGVHPRRVLFQQRLIDRHLSDARRDSATQQQRESLVGDQEPLLEASADWPQLPVHHIIIDMCCCSFIDSVGLNVFNEVVQDFEAAGIHVFLCNPRSAIRSVLGNQEISKVDKRNVFLSNHDAVCAAMNDAARQKERWWIDFESDPSLSLPTRNDDEWLRQFVSRQQVDIGHSSSGSRSAAPTDTTDPLLVGNI